MSIYDVEKLADSLRRKRESRNLTQTFVAKQIGITNREISKWETGITIPRLKYVFLLCDLYQCSVDELLGGKKKNAKSLFNSGSKRTSKI